MANSIRPFLLLAAFLATLVSADIGNLTSGLAHKLSEGAEIYYPGSTAYKTATTRWSASIKPGLDAIVKVASEKDIQATVSSCRSYGRFVSNLVHLDRICEFKKCSVSCHLWWTWYLNCPQFRPRCHRYLATRHGKHDYHRNELKRIGSTYTGRRALG